MSIAVSAVGKVTDLRLVHLRNVNPPIKDRLSGKVMDTRLVQSSKAFVPMDVSPFLKTMEVRPVQA